MRKLVFVIALLCLSTPAMAADLCYGLQGKSLSVHANGIKFLVGPDGIILGLQNGVYSFDTMTNAGQKVTGQCKDRHITFARVIKTFQGDVLENYDGWIFENAPLIMAGIYSRDSRRPSYGWCAEMEFVNK